MIEKAFFSVVRPAGGGTRENGVKKKSYDGGKQRKWRTEETGPINIIGEQARARQATSKKAREVRGARGFQK